MSSRDATTLVHLVGFVTSIVLYAMLGVMTVRSRAHEPSARIDRRGDRIPLATALLGLVWNCGALLIYGLRGFGLGRPSPVVEAVAFSALGFLPAVVVHSAVEGAWGNPEARGGAAELHARLLTGASYALSAAAAAIMFRTAVRAGDSPSRIALLLLVVGFGVILALLVVLAPRRADGRATRGAITAAGLAVFAVMALHLSEHGSRPDSWVIAVAGHHGSLPLALLILYQDYRFALADLFLKRVLTLLALIVLWMLLYAGIAARYVLPAMGGDYSQPLGVALLLTLGLVTAIAYPALRRGVTRFVDRVVLRRADYAALQARLAEGLDALDAPREVLDATCAALGPALAADAVTWSRADAPLRRRSATRVHVPTSEPPGFELEVGRLAGGRRLMSDDLQVLDAVALLVARRIDSIRVTRERYARDLREREILQLATESELRALRAQLNPHFLFNALTTIGQLIQEAPPRALDTLLSLTALLRAVLKRSDGEFVTLAEEVELVRDYLAIERARYEDRLEVAIELPPALEEIRMPPLLVQPLVENAVKHGIAPSRSGGRVTVRAQVEADGVLSLFVVDTGVGATASELERRRGAGIGLTNVARRLARHFGDAARLDIQSAPGVGTTVHLRIPLDGRMDATRVTGAA